MRDPIEHANGVVIGGRIACSYGPPIVRHNVHFDVTRASRSTRRFRVTACVTEVSLDA